MGFVDGLITLIAIGGVLVPLVAWIFSAWAARHTFTSKKEPVPEGSSLEDLIQQRVDRYKLVEVDETEDPTSEAGESWVLTYRAPDGTNVFQLLEMYNSAEAAVSIVRALERHYVTQGHYTVVNRDRVVSKHNKEVIGEGVSLHGSEDGRTNTLIIVWNNHRMVALARAPGSLEGGMFYSYSKY